MRKDFALSPLPAGEVNERSELGEGFRISPTQCPHPKSAMRFSTSPAGRGKTGFSLIELAIGLVIIGLLTGGILMGRGLLRNAEIKSVISELEKYDSAVTMFEKKYDGLPGDIPNATDIWGAVNVVAATCETTPSDGTLTCNGTDDRIISTGPGGTLQSERKHAVIQLKNAGYITGNFTGVGGPGGPTHEVAGVNQPAFPVSRSGMSMTTSIVSGGADPHYFDGVLNPTFHVGGQRSTGSFWTPIFTPEEMWSMDTKMDDGRPAYGRFQSLKSTSTLNPNCATTAIASTALYNLTNQAILCTVLYAGKSEVRREY